MKNAITAAALAAGVIIAVVAICIGSGVYNVAADEDHTRFIAWLIETTRERSIAARTDEIRIPDLGDAERIRRGAGNYDAMCAGCHLKPGAASTELSRGLLPAPPDLTKVIQSDPARAFWIIKHGIKATGMPAWGESMEDSHLWDMVAFIQRLPESSADQYNAEVRASGGHSHGGTESAESAPDASTPDEPRAGHAHDGHGAEESHSHEEH